MTRAIKRRLLWLQSPSPHFSSPPAPAQPNGFLAACPKSKGPKKNAGKGFTQARPPITAKETPSSSRRARQKEAMSGGFEIFKKCAARGR